MTRTFLWKAVIILAGFCLLLVPAISPAQPESDQSLPPIAQESVREGDFAVKLHTALGLGTVPNETEAESALARAGILPRNGWIADYPVTPDIIGELQKAVGDAAASGKLSLEKNEALKRLNAVAAEQSLGIRPQTAAGTGEAQGEIAPEDYPNPAVINDYYESEGPPIVTYYAPPPDYYYLYGWIPYPFWCGGFWFPGYFILHDFHRSFHRHDGVFFVSNHFNDIRSHRVFRVDPVARFNGRTFAGIGATNRRGFISTGVPRSQHTVFNAPRPQAAPGMRPIPGMRSSFRSDGGSRGSFAPAARSTGRSFAAPSRGSAGRGMSAPSGGHAAGMQRAK